VRTRYAYNDTGNVIRRFTADGQVVAYEYDNRQRLLQECFSGDCGAPSSEDRFYFYDDLSETGIDGATVVVRAG